MKIDYEYLTRIRRSVALSTRRKTTNLLDGDFRSIHRGRSMEFDDLKEYAFGDDVHDIDWKSSSRMGTILVRRYMSDRRHNVMFICDRGAKFLGDTDKGESKKELMLMTFGSIAYIVGRNGSDFALAYPDDRGANISYFKSGTDHLERLLYEFEKRVDKNARTNFNDTVRSVLDQARKHMIIFLLTDIDGLAELKDETIKSISENHDLFIMCIDDAYLTGDNVYDNDDSRYVRFFLSHSKALHNEEVKMRKDMMEHISLVCRQNMACQTTVSAQEDIIDKTIDLFERYRNGYFG